MIQAVDLTKYFGEFQAVREIGLDIPQGQVLVLLGPNGAGKTTTIRMLSSVLRPTYGKAMVAGYDVVTQARKVRASVGVLTEQHGLYNRMHANDYLGFFAEAYKMDRGEAQAKIRRLLEQFGLDDAGKKRLGEYSKGMRQKLALVRALLHDPPVLLLDEPTSAMDPQSARMVRDSIRALRSGERTIFLCTHNLFEAEELADRIAIIHGGRIVIEDAPKKLKERLLGPEEYEIHTSSRPGQGNIPEIAGCQIISRENSAIRFIPNEPEKDNPAFLRALLDSGYDVVSVHKVQQSLEKAYLLAIEKDGLPGD